MTDSAKLREALESGFLDQRPIPGYPDRPAIFIGWRAELIAQAVREYAALLESPDIILIRKVDGEWPEQAVSVLMSYLYDHDGTPFTGNPLVLVESALDALSESLKGDG